MSLNVRFRFDGRCTMHPRYNPETDGRPQHKHCDGCESLYVIFVYAAIARRRAESGEGSSLSTDLEAVVGNCLPKLSVVWTAVDTYGCPQNAAVLREVIDDLREAVSRTAISAGAMEFVVSGLFRIPRSQVAQLLSICLRDGQTGPYKISDFRRPPAFAFRADKKFVLRELDYPLNDGGSLAIVPRRGAFRRAPFGPEVDR